MKKDITIIALIHYGKTIGEEIRNNCSFYLSDKLDEVIKELLNKGFEKEASELTEQYT